MLRRNELQARSCVWATVRAQCICTMCTTACTSLRARNGPDLRGNHHTCVLEMNALRVLQSSGRLETVGGRGRRGCGCDESTGDGRYSATDLLATSQSLSQAAELIQEAAERGQSSKPRNVSLPNNEKRPLC